VEQKWKWITPGSLLVIPSWIAVSLAFSYYINNFSSYDKTYGSLGAVIILLLWLYLSGFVMLIGAVVNSVLEHASAEGKEPGEKVAGENEKAAGEKSAEAGANAKVDRRRGADRRGTGEREPRRERGNREGPGRERTA